jgi:hypothetical protein
MTAQSVPVLVQSHTTTGIGTFDSGIKVRHEELLTLLDILHGHHEHEVSDDDPENIIVHAAKINIMIMNLITGHLSAGISAQGRLSAGL